MTSHSKIILVDTREKQPYEFVGLQTITKKLCIGDYSTIADDPSIVERKSANDYIHTIFHEKKRFHKELVLLRNTKRPCIVVEGSFATLRRSIDLYHPMISIESVMKITVAIVEKYCIPVYLCGNRMEAEEFTKHYLLSDYPSIKK